MFRVKLDAAFKFLSDFCFIFLHYLPMPFFVSGKTFQDVFGSHCDKLPMENVLGCAQNQTGWQVLAKNGAGFLFSEWNDF
jgi:hypothetical protein